MVINHVYQVRIFCLYSGQTAINTLYIVPSALTGGMTDQDFLDTLSGIMGPAFRPYMGTDSSFYGMELADMTSVPFALPVYSAIGRGAGTGGGVAMPGQVSGIITKSGLARGRHYRGRVYLPFPSTTRSTGTPAIPDATCLAIFASLLGLLTGTAIYSFAGVNITISWGLYNAKFLAQPFRATPAGVVPPKWATQRKRGDYGKLNAPPF